MIYTIINKKTTEEICRISCLRNLNKILNELTDEEILCIDLVENYIAVYIEYESKTFGAISKEELINMDEDDRIYEGYYKIEDIPARVEESFLLEARIDNISCNGKDLDELGNDMFPMNDDRLKIMQRSNRFFYKCLKFNGEINKARAIIDVIGYVEELFSLYNTEFAETDKDIRQFYCCLDNDYADKYFIENSEELYRLVIGDRNI